MQYDHILSEKAATLCWCGPDELEELETITIPVPGGNLVASKINTYIVHSEPHTLRRHNHSGHSRRPRVANPRAVF